VSNRYFGGPALGRGPVRVVIENRGDIRHGRVRLGSSGHGSPHFISTLWYAVPGYDGPFVVRGARRGRPGRIRVEPGSHSDGAGPFEVRTGLNATVNTSITKRRHGRSRNPLTGTSVPIVNPAAGYRTVPSRTWVGSPGCYAWQVDGRGFSEMIVFDALRERRSPGARRPSSSGLSQTQRLARGLRRIRIVTCPCRSLNAGLAGAPRAARAPDARRDAVGGGTRHTIANAPAYSAISATASVVVWRGTPPPPSRTRPHARTSGNDRSRANFPACSSVPSSG